MSATPDNSPPIVAPPTNDKVSRRALRILIVDDLVDAAESLARLLRYDKHEVRTSYSGAAAVTAAQEFRPDAVLLDIGLPGLDGFDVAQQLREQPECRGVAIIAITGHTQPPDCNRATRAGIDRCLLKPIKIAQLQALLAEFFPGH